VGHVRDVRRLIVALSRARLGLYIFGRQKLFENCHELEPAFRQLLKRPTKLWLKRGERYTDENRRTLAETAKVDRDSESEEDDGEDESKTKAKGKKPSKKDKEAKKAAQEKKKEAQEAKNKERKSYSEIQGVAQIGEYVFGLQKEQQRYALQQQQAYLASLGVPHQGQQQQTIEASETTDDQVKEDSEADKSGKEEDGNAMDVDPKAEHTNEVEN